MLEVAVVGPDLAKNVIQAHERPLAAAWWFEVQLRRGQALSLFEGLPPSVLEIKACVSAHHRAGDKRVWARGSAYASVYVKAHAKCDKDGRRGRGGHRRGGDTADDAVRGMKTKGQQSVPMLQKTRDPLVR